MSNTSASAAEKIMQQARAIQPQVGALTLAERASFMAKLRKVVLDQQDVIIDTIQKDTGKSRFDALVAEIFAVLDYIEFLEKSGPKILAPEKVPTPIVLFPKKSRIYYEPLGVVLAIVPWNYPFYTGLIPCITGFMAGNAVILKPSEFTPLQGLMESLFYKAEFHPHWIQVVYGDGKMGSDLINARPNKIFFTGGTETGKRIMKQAADFLIPVGLELGGKDPMVVFNDANVERATSGAMWGGFCNAGQTCTSVERCYVQSGVYDEFVEKMTEKTKRLTLGTDKDGNSDIGHITTDDQRKKITVQVNDALARGAKQLTGENWDKTSKYIPPIVMVDVPNDSIMMQEETFGPVVPIIKFETEDEAIRLANDSEYGLSASVWGGDKAQVERVARAIVTGNVSVNNVMVTQGNSHLPFGGVKASGFGRTKGSIGVRAFTAPKSVIFDGNNGKIEPNWHPYTSKKYGMFRNVTRYVFSGGVLNLLKAGLTAVKMEIYASKIGKNGR